MFLAKNKTVEVARLAFSGRWVGSKKAGRGFIFISASGECFCWYKKRKSGQSSVNRATLVRSR